MVAHGARGALLVALPELVVARGDALAAAGKVDEAAAQFALVEAIQQLHAANGVDTDLELVRKVIKRVGQEIQDDPRLGPMLLQPVKSQGVTQVDDSGFVIGVKFVSRPGEQFMVRREAYARIKQAFVENGIEFASRRVTVDSEAEGQAGRAAAASFRRWSA